MPYETRLRVRLSKINSLGTLIAVSPKYVFCMYIKLLYGRLEEK
jgi:hypothetical protein